MNTIEYVNHLGERVDLCSSPYLLQDTDLFNWKFKYDTRDGVINRTHNYTKPATEFTLKMIIVPYFTNGTYKSKVDLKLESLERLYEIVQKDIIANRNGRIEIDNKAYMEGKIVGIDKSEILRNNTYLSFDLKFLADNPNWIYPKGYDFEKSDAASLSGLNYNYNYNYNYTKGKIGESTILRRHFGESQFKLTVFGPCINPRIIINDNLYEVFTNISAGEYMIINSKNYTIKKHSRNGFEENLFAQKSKEKSCFAKIPGGNLQVLWNGEFSFQLELYEERSEYGYTS